MVHKIHRIKLISQEIQRKFLLRKPKRSVLSPVDLYQWNGFSIERDYFQNFSKS